MTSILINAFAILEGINNQIFVTSFLNIAQDTGLTMDKFFIILAIQQAAESLTTPFWGAMSDVYSKRVTFNISTALFILSTVATSLSSTFLEFLGARVLCGLSVACFLPASHALLTETVHRENRARAHGHFVAYVALGSIVGATFPLLDLHWRMNFVLIACLTGILSVPVAFTFIESRTADVELKDSIVELYKNLRSTLSLVIKQPSVTAIFFLAISAETCSVLLPLTLIFLQDHLPTKVATYTFSASCVFSALGGFGAGVLSETNNKTRLSQGALLGTLIASSVLFFVSVPRLVMGLCLCSMAFFIPWPQILISRPMLPEFVKPHKTTTALAWLTAAETGFAAALGPPLVGSIHNRGHSLGYALGVIVAGITCLALVATLKVQTPEKPVTEPIASEYGAMN